MRLLWEELGGKVKLGWKGKDICIFGRVENSIENENESESEIETERVGGNLNRSRGRGIEKRLKRMGSREVVRGVRMDSFRKKKKEEGMGAGSMRVDLDRTVVAEHKGLKVGNRRIREGKDHHQSESESIHSNLRKLSSSFYPRS